LHVFSPLAITLNNTKQTVQVASGDAAYWENFMMNYAFMREIMGYRGYTIGYL
jgi:hypothetical protein